MFDFLLTWEWWSATLMAWAIGGAIICFVGWVCYKIGCAKIDKMYAERREVWREVSRSGAREHKPQIKLWDEP